MRNIENYIKNRENPFMCLSPEAKYWIGYIFADGHLTFNTKNRCYSISLFSKNEDILRQFQSFIGNKAHFYKRPTGICQVIYSSKPVTKWFMDTFNIPQNKALVLDPSIEIDWDILHGYFDGDGCVRLSKYKNRWNRYEAMFTTGSLKWANRIMDFLEKEGIQTSIRNKGNAYDVIIRGKANLSYLYKGMYNSNTSKLSYKYKKLDALVGNNYEKSGELLEG